MHITYETSLNYPTAKLGDKKLERDGSMKQTLRKRLVKVIQGYGQVKFHFEPIRLKLGENKPGCDGSMKRTLRTRLLKFQSHMSNVTNA